MQSQWVVPAEWLSFPSGHALRAFHLCFLLADSELVGGALPGGAALTAPRLLLWAAAVGAARVLKGRHYPLDVVAGALLGIILGVLLESHSRRHAEAQSLPFAVVDYARSQQVKAFCGTLLALEWGLYYAVGLAARALAPAVLAILNSMDELWAASHARDAVKCQLIPPVLSLFTRFRPYLAHFFPRFFPLFARFHRLAEAVPTSRKPEPRAEKQRG